MRIFLLLLLAFPAWGAYVGGQLNNAQFDNRTSDYAAGTRGRVWYNTAAGFCRWDDGSQIREFVTKDQTQALTNKDFQGATASNTSRVTIPKDTTTNLNALARKQGTLVYDTTNNSPRYDDGTNLVAFLHPGLILPYGGATAPNGWVLGDGTSYLRTGIYAALFATIGTSFGSADGTHFNVPDCTRRVLVGAGGAGTGTLGNTVGSTGGAETVTLVLGNLPAHTHTFSGTTNSGTTGVTTVASGNHSHTLNSQYTNDSGGGGCTFQFEDCDNSGFYGGTFGFTSTTGSHTHTITDPGHTHAFSGTTDSTGSATGASVIQPSLVVNCLVKL